MRTGVLQQLLCTDLGASDKVEFSLMRAGALSEGCSQCLSKNHLSPNLYPGETKL